MGSQDAAEVGEVLTQTQLMMRMQTTGSMCVQAGRDQL